jgi:hypothetical protein
MRFVMIDKSIDLDQHRGVAVMGQFQWEWRSAVLAMLSHIRATVIIVSRA